MSNTIHNADELHEEDVEIEHYLASVDKMRQECESRGQYIRAQECVNRMREVSLRQAKRLESLSNMVSADAKVDMTVEHRIEILNFNRIWEEKLGEYSDRSDEVLNNLKQSHLLDYTNQEAQIELQLTNKRPRFSSTVLELRASLEKAVQSRKYLEAEEIKQRLSVIEEKELAEFYRGLSRTFERKREEIKKKYINELRAMEKKIKTGLDELNKQRQKDLNRLLLRHQNSMKELDTTTKLHINATKKSLEKKVTVLTNNPSKACADFRGVAQAIMPPATSRKGTSSRKSLTSKGTLGSKGSDINEDHYLW
eukprot:Tbor_TRINITY_DN7556_c0_g1::TRINITY_DN7556_c0_g1_i1::g.918::m.918